MIIKSCSYAALWLIMALFGSSTWAGGTPLEAYSQVGCSMWSLEDGLLEDLARPRPSVSGSPTLRQVLTTELRSATGKGIVPQLFLGQAYPKKKNQQPKDDQTLEIGCIRQQSPVGSNNDDRLRCHVDIGNRIALYVFPVLPKQKKGDLESYGCVGNCTGYPVIAIYEMPWEDGPSTQRQKRAAAEYSKRCL